METRFWYYCIVISLVFNYSTAKPFSLNEVLAAETDQNHFSETTSKIPEKSAERFSLHKVLKSSSTKSSILKDPGNIFLHINKLSPLKYRRKFEIKSPLKPKNFKRSPKSKLRHKNQSVKREINSNDQLKQKYIPLLKNIGMLFDNLLMSDESDSHEIRSRNYKRNRYYSTISAERNGMECACTQRSHNKHAKPKSSEKTVAFETVTTEISTNFEDFSSIATAAETTDNSTVSDFRGVRHNQNVSILLPRDSDSSWRNDIRISERSGSPHNRSVEGNFAWNHGDSEHSTECRQNKSVSKNHTAVTCDAARYSTSGDRSLERRRRNRNNSRSSDPEFSSAETNITTENEDYGYAPKYKRQDKLDVGRNKTKSAKSLSDLIRRLRGFISETEVNSSSNTVQPKEILKESIANVAHDISSHKRFSNRSGTNTEKDKKVGARNETMILTKTSVSSDTDNKISAKTPPALMIIGGYSVTRLKNGENKMSKNAIHIHS